MDTILNLIQNYYGGIIGTGVSIGAIIRIITSWFQKYVITNMLILQKDTTLTNEQKFAKLTSEIYDGLPLIIKLFIGKNSFAKLSQAIYDKIFPSQKTDNTKVDPNIEIKQAIVSIIGDAIDGLEKTTDAKIQDAINLIESGKKDELNKIAENLKQSLGVNVNSTQTTQQQSQPDIVTQQ